jgi:hypothetical protein
MARRTIFGLVAVLALLVIALPALGAPLTAFRLVPMIGWERLEQVNPYATIDSDYVTELASPMAGLRNAEASVVQITARARVDLDTSEAEISADFIPVSGEIVQVGSRLFAAPIGRQLKGTIVLTARNSNDFPIEGVKVEGSLSSTFQPTVSGRSQGNVRLESNASRGPSEPDTTFLWDVGSLLPNEAARCEISVTTRRSSAGGFGFAKEGVYPVDGGFGLTYTMLGKDQTRSTTPLSIIAHENPKALELNTGSSYVASNPFEREWPHLKRSFPERSSPIGPVSGDSEKDKGKPVEDWQGSVPFAALGRESEEPAQIIRGVNESGLFTLIATGVSDNIGVEDDKFTVPSGEEAEWEVEIWVSNPVIDERRPWNGWTVTLMLGADLTAEEIGRLVTIPGKSGIPQGILTIEPDDSTPGCTRVSITWDWQHHGQPKFLQGSSAYLALKVETNGLPLSTDDLTFCDQIQLYHNPEGGGPTTVDLKPIYIRSVQAPHASVSVTATRLDWRVQKPGTYAALATKITASGIGKLSIQFSEFGNLSKVGGTSGTIAASYGFGDNLAAAEAAGWVSAVDLNNEVRYIDLSEPVPVSMWSKISVGEEDSSAEYENTGVITFIVSNN